MNELVINMSEEEYYVGDPCYVIRDEDWHLFCAKTFESSAQSKATHQNMDSVVEWNGALLEIWSNGGDGSWSWGSDSFCVDAGIFAVIPLSCLREDEQEEARRIMGSYAIRFTKKPDLYVEDYIIYLNDEADDEGQRRLDEERRGWY